MAIHKDISSMLRESIQEYLKVAEYCVQFKKDPKEWGSGGCYGMPAAVMLFCILDAIGSYYHGRKEFKILIDGEEKSIDKDGYKFFFILNSHYYNQGLSEDKIRKLYDNYRSLLIHNGTMAFDHFLISESYNSLPFPIRKIGDREVPLVNLYSFLIISRNAVSMFLSDIDRIVPASKQAENIRKKR